MENPWLFKAQERREKLPNAIPPHLPSKQQAKVNDQLSQCLWLRQSTNFLLFWAVCVHFLLLLGTVLFSFHPCVLFAVCISIMTELVFWTYIEIGSSIFYSVHSFIFVYCIQIVLSVHTAALFNMWIHFIFYLGFLFSFSVWIFAFNMKHCRQK